MRNAVSAELQKLENEGVIERIDTSPWVSPVVVAWKKSGKIRLCVDLRDLAAAYHQLPLHKDSRVLLQIIQIIHMTVGI